MSFTGRSPVLATLGAILAFAGVGTALIIGRVPIFLVITGIVLLALFVAAVPLTIRAKIGLVLNIVLSLVVVVGNSASTPHVQIMLSFERPLSSMVLLVGAYILQPLLIALSVIELRRISLRLR